MGKSVKFAYDVLLWLKSWPAPVWAAMGGSAMTLFGVFFSDLRNMKRLHMQNAFTADQSERARLMAIRKEVYLAAAGALAKMQVYLVSLPTAEAQSHAQSAVDFAELIGKVAMIGESGTVLLAQKLAADFSEAQSTLTVLAGGIKSAAANAKNHEGYRTQALEQFNRVGLEISKFLEAGTRDDLKFSALQLSKKRFHEESQQHWSKEVESLREVSKLTNQYIVKAIELMEPLSDSSTALLIAVRRELGNETDAVSLLQAMKENRDRSFQRLRDVIKAYDDELKKDEASQREARE